MLVLTRKKNQKIMIGDDIELTIVDIKNEQIKLGVSAPRHVKVFRKEVYDAIQEENRVATQSDISQEKLKTLSSLFKK
ncbi:MAG: carbon storage regulator CsrA [Candidatus Cloacimonetes bacterium]|nr:carbon storage regulator CsrA [Candidatus Cloacimonadota bacterium]